MVSKRNRVLNLINYIESLGVQVNIKKNTARGNKGFFKALSPYNYRIDISKVISDDDILRVLVHEFAHYIHFKNDKTLQSLNFILDDYDAKQELIELTVDSISKSTVKPLFDKKEYYNQKVKELSKELKSKYHDFKLTQAYKPLENKISKTDYKYLLKHDSVIVHNFLGKITYSISELENSGNVLPKDELNYLKLKSAQRGIRKINGKISKLNKYYNSPTELFARSFEYFIFEPDKMQELTPNLYLRYKDIIDLKKNNMLSEMFEILNKDAEIFEK